MQPNVRRQYLHTLGIDWFVPRDEPAADEEAGGAVDAAEPPAPAAAAPPADWDEFRAAVSACRACELGAGRRNAVFGVGDPAADWMIIGEAPGAEEDRRGEPFVGRAGQLLDAMLQSLSLDRSSVFIANILKCRPPGNRDPRAEEIAACRRFLDRQIADIRPKLLLAVGRIAAQTLLNTTAPVGRLRGRVHRNDDLPVPLVVTYHPAYLLRSPEQKGKVWSDLVLAYRTMQELEPA
ncbi:MAG: uracil-DNA glycosylase [Pseudomonadota bacterium]